MRWIKLIESKSFTTFYFVFSFVVLFSISDHYFLWTNPKSDANRMVKSDAACYYGYMPQWFIYKTANFNFIDSIAKKYPHDGFEDNYGLYLPGKHTNKYFCGTAILSSPFFLIGHAQAIINGDDTDGYSKPYLLWVNIGSVFYAVFGIFGIYLLALRWGFRKWKIYFTLTAILYGTNLFYYSTIDIPYSHVYCFVVIVWVYYSFVRWKDDQSKAWKFIFFLLTGLAIIVRPTNILALAFIPFLWDNWKAFWFWFRDQIKVYWKSTLVGLIVLSVVVFMQFYNVYTQFGFFKFNVYSGEDFDNWKSPFIISTLFGFNKGMFIYSPVLLLMIPGLYFLYQWNSYRFIGFLVTFGLITYVISSWWCWWYGGAFGLRAYIDFYGLFAIPLLLLFEKANKFSWIITLPIVVIGLFLYQTFDTQYKRNIISYDGMSYEKFKLVFLKTEPRYNWLCFRNIDTLSTNFKPIHVEQKFIIPGKKEGTYFNFDKKDFTQLPYVRIDLQKLNDENVFAYRFEGEANIHGEGSYLSLITQGYKQGNKVFEMDHPYGHIPNKTNQWSPVFCDVVTDWPIKELDSVKVTFYYTSMYSEIKLKQLTWGSDK